MSEVNLPYLIFRLYMCIIQEFPYLLICIMVFIKNHWLACNIFRRLLVCYLNIEVQKKDLNIDCFFFYYEIL